jgi:imidazole glycerol-phosphate synthase subunit HisF
MNRPRIIPVLTIANHKLVKTVRFKNPNYIGDPLNAIKIFNDKRVDELMILDITASKENKIPNYKLIEEMAGEAFMPLGYGGGIKNFEQAKQVFSLGIEKIILNSVIIENPKLITKISDVYGSQSVVISLDYKKKIWGSNKPYFYSGQKKKDIDLLKFTIELIDLGAGEIILNDIERDGTFAGYNFEIYNTMKSMSVPIVLLGGCSGLINLKEAISNGVKALAASSIFVYKNNNTQSILINYPNL